MKPISPNVAQTALFEDILPGQPTNGKNGTAFSDPSFATNKTSPIHRWVPWIAGFSKDFVSDAIGRHLRRPGVILDPFAGVGTTLVEAVLSGHDAVGFEINPYAALACKVKLSATRVSQTKLSAAISRYEDFYHQALQESFKPRSVPPPGFKTRTDFYSPQVLQKVLITQDFIRNHLSANMRDLFSLAFAATMVSYSNYSYEPSLSRRTTAGKSMIHDFRVGETIAAKLREMKADLDWLASQSLRRSPQSKVFNASFFGCRNFIDSGSVDLVVTSPPYLNNYHYNRNTRPHLYWLDFVQAPGDMTTLEHKNFGKYWQTVRESAAIPIDFPNPPCEILETLDLIRAQKPEKGIYGGNGWANYAATYFNDCYRFSVALRWAMKRRATALVVIGNNIIQGIMVPTDQFLGKIAECAGLHLVDIHIPRKTRVGNSIIKSNVRVATAKKSHRLYEAVVELRKK